MGMADRCVSSEEQLKSTVPDVTDRLIGLGWRAHRRQVPLGDLSLNLNGGSHEAILPAQMVSAFGLYSAIDLYVGHSLPA
jgi:hypothetical protein